MRKIIITFKENQDNNIDININLDKENKNTTKFENNVFNFILNKISDSIKEITNIDNKNLSNEELKTKKLENEGNEE